jgi:hypothetical protein
MSDTTPKNQPNAKATGAKFQLPIHFIKSTNFRVVHANGVWYGGDNQGNLHMTFFNERSPLPKMVVVNLDETGHVVGEDESKREARPGVVREMEVDVVLSIQVATELYQTLGANLKSIQEALKNSAYEKASVVHGNIK